MMTVDVIASRPDSIAVMGPPVTGDGLVALTFDDRGNQVKGNYLSVVVTVKQLVTLRGQIDAFISNSPRPS